MQGASVQPCAAMFRKRDKAFLTGGGGVPSLEEASGLNHFCDHACGHTSASPDVDECLEQLDECHYNQLCENTPGGHHCGCPRGYHQQGHRLPCLGKGTARTPSGSLVSLSSASGQGVLMVW